MSELIVLPAGKIITVAIAAKHRSLCGTGATIQFVSMVVSEEFGFIRNVDNVGIENGVSRDIRTRVFDGHNDVLSKLRNTGGVANTESFLSLPAVTMLHATATIHWLPHIQTHMAFAHTLVT